MKTITKLLMLALIVTTISCSKEKKLQRKLDGDWEVILSTHPDKIVGNITFGELDKSNNKGDIKLSVMSGARLSNVESTYSLADEGSKIKAALPGGTEWIVDKFTKKELELTESSNPKFIYKLKRAK